MNSLSPASVVKIAAGAYFVENKTISRTQEEFGIGGMFNLEHGSRFEGETGGRLWSRLSGFGYIAEGEGIHEGEVLIAIRGTNPLSGRDWLTDARAGFCRGDSGHPVHIGFQSTWESFKDDVRKFLLERMPRRVHCVGHSLGGALASLCADYCANTQAGAVSLYTVGSPRAGMVAFASNLTGKIGTKNIFRISHAADPVTLVPVYPFSHVPYQTRNYVVGGTGLMINPWAHPMPSYAKAVGQASWSSLLDRSPQIIVADEVKRWLASVSAGGGVTALAADSLAMIGKVLGWILEREYQNWGVECANYYTALDHLAQMIERGVKFTKEAEEQIKTVMNAILRFVGRAAVTITNLTLAFVQYVSELFSSTISLLAAQAMRSLK